MGGGFGCKLGASAPGSGFVVEAARAAVALGKPVRAMLDRREENAVGGNRPSSEQTMRIGLRKDGKVLAYTVRIRGTGGVVDRGTGARNPMIYELGAQAREELTVATMAGPHAAFRAPGHPQGSFALESMLDEAAEAIGMDALEFRRGLDRSRVRLAQYEEGAKRIGWEERRRAKPGSGKGPLKRGVGMGSATWYHTGGPRATVQVTVHRDGGVEVFNGAQDIGTGTRTLLAIVVAEVLGLEPGEVRVHLGRTEWPAGPGSGGSCTAPTLGPAARAAAEKARQGILGDAPAGDRKAWLAACARIEEESRTFQNDPAAYFRPWEANIAGCQFAEVEVDVETGVVRVLRVVAVQDCGRVIDRLTAESQILGGVIQGISFALFENRNLDRKTGRLLNGDLERYRIAGSKDIPDVEVVAFSVANAGNSVGMSGIGEPPTIPTAGAIANAVYHATGARVRELPITPARVLAALAAKEK
jgi:xanthine dehydrogenase YagR molybdenum-binding subunit